MAEPYLGEIRMVGFNFAPEGWALCNGQTLPINQNQALFSLLGTFYGGNGTSTFALPDLRSRVAVHQGQGIGLSPYTIGQVGGAENVTLNANQMPGHTHQVNALPGGGNSASPQNNLPAIESTGTSLDYSNATTGFVQMNSQMIGTAGGSQPHENRQPFLCVNFVIALQGIFPSRN